MSQRFELTGWDWKKIRTGALVALAGAIVAFLPQAIADVRFVAWGYDYTAFVGMTASIIINALRKYVSEAT